MDGYLDNNMQTIVTKAIPNNWDNCGVIFGREGSAKSTLATQICKRLDPSFNVDRVVFTPETFIKAIDDAQPGQAIQYDEAINSSSSSTHASGVSVAIVRKLTMVRKKKLHIILCFPYLYMLQKYYISRCLWSIYTYAKDFDDRGYGRFYNSVNTERLYDLMKMKHKFDYMGAIREMKANFHFKFPRNFCVDELEYEIKKDAASIEDPNKKKNIWKDTSLKLAQYIKCETAGSIRKACLQYEINYNVLMNESGRTKILIIN